MCRNPERKTYREVELSNYLKLVLPSLAHRELIIPPFALHSSWERHAGMGFEWEPIGNLLKEGGRCHGYYTAGPWRPPHSSGKANDRMFKHTVDLKDRLVWINRSKACKMWTESCGRGEERGSNYWYMLVVMTGGVKDFFPDDGTSLDSLNTAQAFCV